MNFYDILFAKKLSGGGSAPLPANAYLLNTLSGLPDDEAVVSGASALPLAELKAEITPTQTGTPWWAAEDEKTPYLFRPSPQLGNDYNRENETIVGGSVAWNQLWRESIIPSDSAIYSSSTYTANNVTFTKNGDGSISVQTTAEGASAQTSVKIASVYNLGYLNFNHYIRAVGGSLSTAYINYASTRNVDNTGNIYDSYPSGYNMWIIVPKDAIITTAIKIYPQIHNLDIAFGTSIATYAYTLEQSEAGSGIAWLKSQGFFTKDYYAYDAGSIKSVQTSAKKVVGFNQWDEQWEVGTIVDGEDAPSTTALRAKNHIPVFPNTNYFFKGVDSNARYIVYYDVNKNYISTRSASYSNIVFTTPSNCYYLRFVYVNYIASYSTYNHDICINLHWDGERDGEYEAYTEHTYPLDSDLELRGVPKLDSSNNLYYDGDTYASDGTVTRRYGIVDLGTLNWSKRTEYTDRNDFEVNINTATLGATAMICSKYSVWNGSRADAPDKTIFKGNQVDSRTFMIRDDSYTDAATFKTAMSGVYCVYELATATTESVDPYTNPQIVSNWGTEEFVDERDVPVPVGHETRYYNEAPIVGFTEMVITRTAGQDSKTYTIDLDGTVYGGVLDVVSGELTISWGYIASYNGESLPGEWLSSLDVYAAGTTPTTGAKVAYELATSTVVELTPTAVATLLGSNTFTANTGDILSLKYFSKS